MQEFINVSRETGLKFCRDNFIKVHTVTPEEAQVARGIVEQNQLIVSNLIENGQVTEDQIDQVLDDPEILDIYSRMWNTMESNNGQTFRRLFDDINLEPDMYCGWLDFYNECLSDSLQLNLIPMTRDTYNYQNYLEEGPVDY